MQKHRHTIFYAFHSPIIYPCSFFAWTFPPEQSMHEPFNLFSPFLISHGRLGKSRWTWREQVTRSRKAYPCPLSRNDWKCKHFMHLNSLKKIHLTTEHIYNSFLVENKLLKSKCNKLTFSRVACNKNGENNNMTPSHFFVHSINWKCGW